MNDREMATAYLLTLKRAGREYAWAAMETAVLMLMMYGNMYQVVPENQERISQLAQQYQETVDGNSRSMYQQ